MLPLKSDYFIRLMNEIGSFLALYTSINCIYLSFHQQEMTFPQFAGSFANATDHPTFDGVELQMLETIISSHFKA